MEKEPGSEEILSVAADKSNPVQSFSFPSPTPPNLHSSHPNLNLNHQNYHPNPRGSYFSGYNVETAHPSALRLHILHPSPLARTSSNSSLCSVLTPEKMKSIISGI